MADVENEAEVAPAAQDVFDRLAEIWDLKTPEEQRSKAASILSVEDRPGVSRESLQLDYSFHTLLYAKEGKFSKEQTKFFYEMMMSLLEEIKGPGSSLDSTSALFKKLLLEPLRSSSSSQPKEAAEEASKEEQKDEAAKGEKPEGEEQKPQEAKKVALHPSMYSHGLIRGMIDYVKDSILRHHALYRAVFGQDCSQQKKTVTFQVSTTEEEDGEGKYKLSEGTVQTGEEKDSKSTGGDEAPELDIMKDSQIDAKSTRVAELVKAHLLKAQSQMNKTLAENAKQMQAKMKQFEAQVSS